MLLGMVMEVRVVMFLNALAPMLVTTLLVVGIVVALQPAINVWVEVLTIQLLLGELNVVPSTVIVVKLLQPLNAVDAMLVTLLGMEMDSRPLQPLNALALMLVTLLGIVIDFSPVQPLNTLDSMLVTLLEILMDVSPVQF